MDVELLHANPGGMTVGPCAFDEHVPNTAVAALGDAVTPHGCSRLSLAWHKAQIAHELPWILEARHVADFRSVNAYKCLSLLDHDTFSAIAKAQHLRRPHHHSVSAGLHSVAQRTYGLTNTTTTVAAFTRNRSTRRDFPTDVQREKVIIPARELCPCCGSDDLSHIPAVITESLKEPPLAIR